MNYFREKIKADIEKAKAKKIWTCPYCGADRDCGCSCSKSSDDSRGNSLFNYGYGYPRD